jgi:hypothetical protein
VHGASNGSEGMPLDPAACRKAKTLTVVTIYQNCS